MFQDSVQLLTLLDCDALKWKFYFGGLDHSGSESLL